MTYAPEIFASHLQKRLFFKNPDLPFTIVHRDRQVPYPLHTHDFSELVVVLSGKGKHYSNTGEYIVKSGDCYVIHEDESHGYKDVEDLRLINIMFDLQELGLPLDDLRRMPGFHIFFTLEPEYREQHQFEYRLSLRQKQLGHVEQLIEEMDDEIRQKAPGHEAMVKANFFKLLVFLSRCTDQLKTSGSETISGIAEALSYIENNYTERIKIEQLLQLSNMSEATLKRGFKRNTGFPPIEYLNRLRIRKACSTLRSTDLPVTQIAFDCGFSDSNYLSRVFKKVMNMTPLEYRKNAQF